MSKSKRLYPVALALLAALAIGIPGALGGGAETPGVTATTILLGGTAPLSGPETAYAPVALGADAYFKYVNDRGGVYGRKIVYKVLDDAFEPARTVQAVRELVQQDGIFAIVNMTNTDSVIATRQFLNELKVPQLFVGSGASAVGLQYKSYPWTIGYLPSHVAEGEIFGRYVLKNRARARIAVLYENSIYGQEMLSGLKKALVGKAGQIVATETFQVTDIDLNSQLSRLAASKADTFMMFMLPKQAIQSYIGVGKLGWHPQIFASSITIDPFVMDTARLNGGSTEGAISLAFLNDPTNPAFAKLPGVKLYKEILRRYLPNASLKEVAHEYGMAVAFTVVDALKRAGRNLTREGFLRAATHLNETDNPFLRPGIVVRTSPTNYFPLSKLQFLRYHNGLWVPFGRLVDARP